MSRIDPRGCLQLRSRKDFETVSRLRRKKQNKAKQNESIPKSQPVPAHRWKTTVFVVLSLDPVVLGF